MPAQIKTTGKRSNVQRLVVQDIVASMRFVAKDHPIVNDSSFAIKILWDIFEAAADYLDKFEEVMALCDTEVEAIFRESFPLFLSEYPKVMELDV